MGMLLHNITVEHLKSEDFKWFVETACVRMLTEEVGRPELVNLPQLEVIVSTAMKSGTVFIAKHDGLRVGGVGGILVPNPFNPNITTLAELMWYVIPEYRKTRAGSLLLNKYMKRAEEVADEATFSLLNTSEVNTKTLEKRGFTLSEYAFRTEFRSK